MTIEKINHRTNENTHATYIALDGGEYQLLMSVQSPLLIKAGLFDVYMDFITALHNAGLKQTLSKEFGIMPPHSDGHQKQ